MTRTEISHRCKICNNRLYFVDGRTKGKKNYLFFKGLYICYDCFAKNKKRGIK